MRWRAWLGTLGIAVALGAAAWFVGKDGAREAPDGRADHDAGPRSPDSVSPATANETESGPTPETAPQRTVDAPDVSPATAPRRIFGRVVDVRRVGVAGAKVRWVPADRAALETASGDGGAFEFAIATVGEKRLSGSLFATGDDGSVAIRYASLSAETEFVAPDTDPWFQRDCDAGVLTLLAPARLAVHVRDEKGPVPGAEVTVSLSPSLPMKLPPVVTDGGGTALVLAPRGDATVVARAPGRGVASRWTPCESGIEQTIDLQLHATFSVSIRVLDAQTRAPVKDARIELGEVMVERHGMDLSFSAPEEIRGSGLLPDVPCDADGVAHLDAVDPERRQFAVARAPGYDGDANRASLDGSKREIELLLTAKEQRDLRFPIVADESPVPPDGTVVTLRAGQASMHFGLPPRAVVDRGELLLVDAPESWQRVVATTPEGAVAGFEFGPDHPTPTLRFRRTRTLEVKLRYGDGRAAARASVELRDRSNGRVARARAADDEGRILFTRLFPNQLELHLPDVQGRTEVLAAADVRERDASVEAVVPERFEVVLACTIDGRRALPPVYRISASTAVVEVLSEDPERGELRVSSFADAQQKELDVWFVAPMFVPVLQTKLPVARGAPPPVVPIALQRGATLLLDVLRAPDQKFALRIQRLGADGTFANLALQYEAVKRVNGPEGHIEFAPLEAGTWRVIDEVTSTASDPIVLAAGERHTATFDLSGALVIHGRVTAPAGADLRQARIIARGEPLEVPPDPFGRPRLPGTPVGPDGTFERTLNGAQPFVRVWHPSLAPPPGDPYVDASDPTRAVELVLVERSSLTFTIVRSADPVPELERFARAKLALGLDREDGEPVHIARTVIGTGEATETVRLSEVPAGRWTICIDPGEGLAAVVRTGIEIPADGIDLGEVTIGRGSLLRLQIDDARTGAKSSLNVEARRVGVPTYERLWSCAAKSDVALPGLGAGRFEIVVGDATTGKPLWKGAVEVDGEHETPLAIDLR